MGFAALWRNEKQIKERPNKGTQLGTVFQWNIQDWHLREKLLNITRTY